MFLAGNLLDDNEVVQNIIAIQDAFTKKGIDYSFCLAVPVSGHRRDVCRRYTLPRRYRDSERIRLDFLQVFNANRPYNLALPDYCFKMSVVSSYELKNYGLNSSYPDVGGDNRSVLNPTHNQQNHHQNSHQISHHQRRIDHHGSDLASTQAQLAGFPPSAFNPLLEEVHAYNARSASSVLCSPQQDVLTPLTPPQGIRSPPATVASERIRFDSDEPRFRIERPDRAVYKNAEGKFECNWADCTEVVKTFNRKCEWK